MTPAQLELLNGARELEDRINSIILRLHFKTQTQEQNRSDWDELASLVKQRTPERVAEMERERGLAR